MNQEFKLADAPTVILVRPQLGENIGAVARAMLNFGLLDLRVVCPRDGWPNQQAIAVASGAGKILENATIFNSTLDACADFNYIFASTARTRGLSKEVYSPKKAISNSCDMIRAGLKVGFMFGPESSGLQNNDVSLAQAIISVPINPKFSSLNLAQCVVILAYEWLKLTQKEATFKNFEHTINYASLIEVEHLRSSLFEYLTASNYFWPEDKKESLTENLTNLLGRLALTSSDVRTLHGVFKALNKEQTNN